MNTKFEISATAPTAYQHASLQRFGMPVKNCGGSYTASQLFDTRDEAEDYLRSRAEQYFETEQELEEAYADIARGFLRIDAVTAHLDEVEVEEDEN